MAVVLPPHLLKPFLDALKESSGARLSTGYVDGDLYVEPVKPKPPETGEKLGEQKPTMVDGKCYICKRNNASIYFSAAIPQCGACYDRFRRRE